MKRIFAMAMDTRFSLVRRAAALAGLALLASPRISSAEWPACGRAIVTAPTAQVHSAITGDGAGGAIITWQDFRSPNINVFAQHVLASGELDRRWPLDGRARSEERRGGKGGRT